MCPADNGFHTMTDAHSLVARLGGRHSADLELPLGEGYAVLFDRLIREHGP